MLVRGNRCKPLWKKKGATSSSVWSAWTECLICPHEPAVLVHVKTRFLFSFCNVFVVNSHCISVFLCRRSRVSSKSKSHVGDPVMSRGYLWVPAGLFIAIVICTRLQEENVHKLLPWEEEEEETERRRKDPEVFVIIPADVGLSFAITALLVILAWCHSSQKENNHAIVCHFNFN